MVQVQCTVDWQGMAEVEDIQDIEGTVQSGKQQDSQIAGHKAKFRKGFHMLLAGSHLTEYNTSNNAQ